MMRMVRSTGNIANNRNLAKPLRRRKGASEFEEEERSIRV